MGQRRPGLLRAGFRRVGGAPSSGPSGGGASGLNFTLAALFESPFAVPVADGQPIVRLGQAWYDFDTIPGTGDVDLLISAEVEPTASGSNAQIFIFGLFIIPTNVDPVVTTLWDTVMPVLELFVAGDIPNNTFQGRVAEGTATRPTGEQQMLLAVQSYTIGQAYSHVGTDFNLRSAIVKIG